jgi:transglutaminase-like putative cysteine protease
MRSERLLVAGAELVLAAVTLAAVAGMHRLFAEGSWAGPLLANAVAAHVVATVLRRRGVPLGATAVVMAVLAVLVTTWACYWSTTALGVPTADTWTALRDDIDAAWRLYQEEASPVPVATGFLAVSSIAVWTIVYVADWAAFRLWVPFEATLPAGTLFLFTSLLGTEAGRAWSVAAYAAALLGFLLLHRLARQEGTSHWVTQRRAAGHRALVTAGSALAVVAVAVGSVVGPALPGSDAPGVLDPRDLDGDEDPRVTISPLVDIRSRLVDQSQVEVFTVRSEARAYWRLTSLERFDGRIWSSSGSYGEADGDLPEAVDTDVATESVEQAFSISALASIWLPSAYEPRAFDGGDTVDARYDEESGTLIVDSAVETSDGLSYAVTSASPRIHPDDLDGTAAEIPRDIRSRFLGLPDDFSPAVREQAQAITAGRTTPYEMALALQDHLRGFTYDLTVPEGHSGNDLERFLFETQAGYCEQFAGAFAAMARAVGLPARVAVGFTPGDEDPAQPGLFRVRGEYAHAWPEVFFPGAGWVAFEPTPGRGMPAAEPYTGVPEQQAAPGRPNDATVVTAAPQPAEGDTGGTTPTTTPAGTGGALEGPGDSGGGAAEGGDDAGERSSVERYVTDPLRRIVPAVVGLLLLYAVVVPAALLARRRRRRAAARTPGERIGVAWTEVAEDAAMIGYRERASDTYLERADRLGALLPAAQAPALELAMAREAADYSPAGAGRAEVDAALQAADRVGQAVRAVVPRRALVQRWLDPRPAVAAWRHGWAGRRRHITTVAATPAEPEAQDELVGVGDRG